MVGMVVRMVLVLLWRLVRMLDPVKEGSVYKQEWMSQSMFLETSSNVSAKWPECDFFLACPLCDYIDLFWFKYPQEGTSRWFKLCRNRAQHPWSACCSLFDSDSLDSPAYNRNQKKKWNMEYSSLKKRTISRMMSRLMFPTPLMHVETVMCAKSRAEPWGPFHAI
jgi:hypothetical protein